MQGGGMENRTTLRNDSVEAKADGLNAVAGVGIPDEHWGILCDLHWSYLVFGGECLEWKIRFKVAIGVAKGLQYLHHDCSRRIIQRDIKASNILLNHNNVDELGTRLVFC